MKMIDSFGLKIVEGWNFVFQRVATENVDVLSLEF